MRKCLPILLLCFSLLCLCLPLFFQHCNVAQAETYTITAGDYIFNDTLTKYTGTTAVEIAISFSNSSLGNCIGLRFPQNRNYLQFVRSSGNTNVYNTYWINVNYMVITVLQDTVVNSTFYTWFSNNASRSTPTVDIWWDFKTDYNRPYPLAFTYFGELGSTYKVTEPALIGYTPPNYTFVGWYDESGNLFDFDELQTANELHEQHYLYARWDTPYDSLFDILILPYTAFFDGFGSGVDWLFNELFIDDSGYYLSTYGQFILYIAGATFVVYIIKTVLYFVIRGDKKCKKD